MWKWIKKGLIWTGKLAIAVLKNEVRSLWADNTIRQQALVVVRSYQDTRGSGKDKRAAATDSLIYALKQNGKHIAREAAEDLIEMAYQRTKKG